MKYKEYIELRKRLEEKLKALDLVYQMAQENENGASNGGSMDNKTGYGSLTKDVKEIVDGLKETFTAKVVSQHLRQKSSDYRHTSNASIATVLNRLDGKMVEMVEKGSGKKPTTYKKKVVKIEVDDPFKVLQ